MVEFCMELFQQLLDPLIHRIQFSNTFLYIYMQIWKLEELGTFVKVVDLTLTVGCRRMDFIALNS